MNKIRRKDLERAIKMLEDARDIIDTCKNEEQEAFDNLPEGFQQSDRGEAMEAAVSEMDDAIDEIDRIIDSIQYDVIDV